MSSEDEPELKDLVLETLENQGVLSAIRAQLRASLYVALEKSSKENMSQANRKLKDALSDPTNKLLFSLVKEFLEYFNLRFSLSVFESESMEGNEFQYNGREALIKSLGLNLGSTFDGPLILHILNKAMKSIKRREMRTEEDSVWSQSELHYSKCTKSKRGKATSQSQSEDNSDNMEDSIESAESQESSSISLRPVSKIVTSPKDCLNETYNVGTKSKKDLKTLLSPRSIESSSSDEEIMNLKAKDINGKTVEGSNTDDRLLGDLPPLNTHRKTDFRKLTELLPQENDKL